MWLWWCGPHVRTICNDVRHARPSLSLSLLVPCVSSTSNPFLIPFSMRNGVTGSIHVRSQLLETVYQVYSRLGDSLGHFAVMSIQFTRLAIHGVVGYEALRRTCDELAWQDTHTYYTRAAVHHAFRTNGLLRLLLLFPTYSVLAHNALTRLPHDFFENTPYMREL